MTIPGTKGKIRVVAFHQGALGDFLMAAGAIDGPAEALPGVSVEYWSKPEHTALLSGKRYLGKCHPLAGNLIANLLHDDLWRTAGLPDFLIEADRVFIFGQAGSRVMAERLSFRLSANVNWIQSFPAAGNRNGTHVLPFLQKQLECLGWPPGGKAFRIEPPESEKRAAKDFLHELGIGSPPVLLHPGSGGRRKIWPLSNWHELIEWLREASSIPILLSVGPADDYLDEFSKAMRKTGVRVVSGLSTARFSALLSLCALYAGSDSGVTHLAAAVGVPSVAVFGPTDPAVWGPRGEHVFTVRRSWEESDILGWTPPAAGIGPGPFRDEDIAGFFSGIIKKMGMEDREEDKRAKKMASGRGFDL